MNPNYMDHKNSFGSFKVSAIIHISEIANELHEESPTYSTTNLLSDLGGALGLCLGLSIWTILKAMCKCKITCPYETTILSANPSHSSGEIEISVVDDFLFFRLLYGLQTIAKGLPDSINKESAVYT